MRHGERQKTKKKRKKGKRKGKRQGCPGGTMLITWVSTGRTTLSCSYLSRYLNTFSTHPSHLSLTAILAKTYYYSCFVLFFTSSFKSGAWANLNPLNATHHPTMCCMYLVCIWSLWLHPRCWVKLFHSMQWRVGVCTILQISFIVSMPPRLKSSVPALTIVAQQ